MMQQSSVKAAKGRKLNSLKVKYMRFCVDTHSAEEPKLPVLENFNLVNLMLFGLWCAHNGVKSGYDGVSNYIAAAVKMAGRFEVKDPRKASAQAEWWWADYVFKFKRNVQAVRRPKLKVQPAHHQAIAADFDVEHDAEDRRDAAVYAFLMFCTCRIGHVAPHDTQTGAHVVRFCDVVFKPSFEAPTSVFVLLRSTKTRHACEAKPTWQAVGALEPRAGIDVETMCPVRTLRRYMLEAYAGDPYEPLFQSATQPGKSMPRSQFTTMFKARLMVASRHLNVPVNIAMFSGVSWRKGGLSALAGGVAVNHLADHGDHKDIRSTREYTQQTISERAGHSGVIAAKYAPGTPPSNEPRRALRGHAAAVAETRLAWQARGPWA